MQFEDIDPRINSILENQLLIMNALEEILAAPGLQNSSHNVRKQLRVRMRDVAEYLLREKQDRL